MPLYTGLAGSARLRGGLTESGFRRLWEERGRMEEARSVGCRGVKERLLVKAAGIVTRPEQSVEEA